MKEPALPGIKMSSSELTESLQSCAHKKNIAAQKTAKHKNADGSPRFVNRLVLETSPYLLQHAFNPINWHPWGDEAFLKAKTHGRPVLLSIGYSTCHWCHVMEEESFEDLEIASLINENYIAIKVDREERPELDAIYMAAVQALTGRGGWPMTVFLTPDRKPFYGGTYFPARDGDRGIQAGFLTLLRGINEAYHKRSNEVALSANELSAEIVSRLSPQHESGAQLDYHILDKAAEYFVSIFDARSGGAKGAPKFPSTFPIRFLLRQAQRTGDQKLLAMVTLTLKKMAHGGIFDQVGGGFHRYSTDAEWRVPHFEKMLYDNALLIIAYIEAYQINHDAEFARIVKETVDFIEREMTSPEGAFYSAIDADSETPWGHKDEGYFYTWSLDEIEKVLGKDKAVIVADVFQVGRGAEHEGRSILHLAERISSDRDQAIVDESKIILELARSKRPPPHRDEKILTSWNGLMISALARAGFVLDEQRYIDCAIKDARFLINKIYINKEIRHSYSDCVVSLFGFLDDYAFLIAAFLDLHEVTQDPEWLSHAIALEHTLEMQFEDQSNGGFFMTSIHHEKLLAREKPSRDGAEPSGNSVAILNLLRLHELTLNAEYKRRAEQALNKFSYLLSHDFHSVSELLLALDYDLDRPKVIAIVTPKNGIQQAQPFLTMLRQQFLPNHALIIVEEGESLAALSAIIPFLQNKKTEHDQATAYLCEQGRCQLPTIDSGVLETQLRSL